MGFASPAVRDRIARSMHTAECVCEGEIESCEAYQQALRDEEANAAADAGKASAAVGR